MKSGIHFATVKAWAEKKHKGQLITQWGQTEAEARNKVKQYINRHG